MKQNTTAVATINNVDILLIENKGKYIAIKPICEALGVNFSSQARRLKNDTVLSSFLELKRCKSSDNKNHLMITLPLKYVFGWLFKINSKNVKNTSSNNVIKRQIECYDSLIYYALKK